MRIKDPSLAERIDAAEQSWWRVTRPVLSQLAESVATLDLAGTRVACFQHIRPDSPLILLPLGIAWILGGGAMGARPGLQPYPPEIEREIAELALAART